MNPPSAMPMPPPSGEAGTRRLLLMVTTALLAGGGAGAALMYGGMAPHLAGLVGVIAAILTLGLWKVEDAGKTGLSLGWIVALAGSGTGLRVFLDLARGFDPSPEEARAALSAVRLLQAPPYQPILDHSTFFDLLWSLWQAPFFAFLGPTPETLCVAHGALVPIVLGACFWFLRSFGPSKGAFLGSLFVVMAATGWRFPEATAEGMVLATIFGFWGLVNRAFLNGEALCWFWGACLGGLVWSQAPGGKVAVGYGLAAAFGMFLLERITGESSHPPFRFSRASGRLLAGIGGVLLAFGAASFFASPQNAERTLSIQGDWKNFIVPFLAVGFAVKFQWRRLENPWVVLFLAGALAALYLPMFRFHQVYLNISLGFFTFAVFIEGLLLWKPLVRAFMLAGLFAGSLAIALRQGDTPRPLAAQIIKPITQLSSTFDVFVSPALGVDPRLQFLTLPIAKHLEETGLEPKLPVLPVFRRDVSFFLGEPGEKGLALALEGSPANLEPVQALLGSFWPEFQFHTVLYDTDEGRKEVCLYQVPASARARTSGLECRVYRDEELPDRFLSQFHVERSGYPHKGLWLTEGWRHLLIWEGWFGADPGGDYEFQLAGLGKGQVWLDGTPLFPTFEGDLTPLQHQRRGASQRLSKGLHTLKVVYDTLDGEPNFEAVFLYAKQDTPRPVGAPWTVVLPPESKAPEMLK